MPLILRLPNIFIYLSFLIYTAATAQSTEFSMESPDPQKLIVRNIIVEGNNSTNESIILREVLFGTGDTILRSDLVVLMEKSLENILKTSLFHNATIDKRVIELSTDSALIKTSSIDSSVRKVSRYYKNPAREIGISYVSIVVNVTERWYWWIWPMLEHPDRNFNDWAQHEDITRLSGGVYFQHENMFGKMEKLNIRLLGGYRTYIAANYEWPYINKNKTIGIGLLGSYYTQHEVNYATVSNKQLYYEGNQFMLTSYNLAIYTRFRPGIHFTHLFTVQHNTANFNDSIRILNPSFYLQTNQFQLLGFSYLLKVDFRDNRNYPLRGYYMEAEASHLKNISSSFSRQSMRMSLRGYLPLGNHLYTASEIVSKITSPRIKPYPLQNALGFDRDFVRGYEYQVIEAPHYWIFKSHLRYAIIPDLKIRLPLIRSEKFNPVPLSAYAGIHYDMGKSFPALNPQTNSLQGKLLTGYGVGIDIVTFYDKVVRVEYTFRHNGQGGLFINFMAMI